MIIILESIILCIIFTVAVFIFSRDPIKTLYNYPPKIQERVKSLSEYKDKIPTSKNKSLAKGGAIVIFTLALSMILHHFNGCTTFSSAFKTGFILWTIVNLYDFLVLDVIWFCHDSYFVFKGTEDMTKEYHNYAFHFNGFLYGEGVGLAICLIVSIIIQYLL